MKLEVHYPEKSEIVEFSLSHRFMDLRDYFKLDGKAAEAVEILSRYDEIPGVSLARDIPEISGV